MEIQINPLTAEVIVTFKPYDIAEMNASTEVALTDALHKARLQALDYQPAALAVLLASGFCDEHILSTKKIMAIKKLRQEANCDLLAAKDAIEAHMKTLSPMAYLENGFDTDPSHHYNHNPAGYLSAITGETVEECQKAMDDYKNMTSTPADDVPATHWL